MAPREPDEQFDAIEAGFEDQTAESLAVFNAILRHHVRNHLTVIQGQAQWLERAVDADPSAVETITRRCEEMAATVDRIEAVTSAISDGAEPEVVSLSTFVSDEIDTVENLYDTEILLDLPAEGPEVVAKETLSFALRELLDNCATHTECDVVRITVDADRTHGHVLVSDDGPGLPESVTDDPFAHSVRGPDSTGDGIGLFLCRAIVTQYDGEVVIEEASDGVTVRIDLPLA